MAAVRAAGGPEPVVLAHADLLRDLGPLEAVPDTPRWVRIESVGEDAEVERRLLALGYSGGLHELDPEALRRRPSRHGELLAPGQHHRGFSRYLRRLDAVFEARPAWRVLSPVPAIERLFDKAETWRRHVAAGLPVPEALTPAPRTPDDLRAAMRARGWTSAFVKLTCGSSASGLGVFMIEPTERLMTTLVREDGGWFNSLRVRRASRPRDIEAALGFILGEGAHVERAVPKARLDGAVFDLRVVVIDGAPTFTVVRHSRHPITNLHLGGWRGDLERLRAEVPVDSLAAAYESCRRAAELQGCFHLGVDLLFEPGLRAHRVVEANAFGDLVPGLEVDGRSVYAHQVHRLQARDCYDGRGADDQASRGRGPGAAQEGSMKVWFEGSDEVQCGIERVKATLQDLGEHYVEVIRRMPGMSEVELVAQDADSVTIKTDEGLMKRTNIAVRVEDERVVVELDEEYQAGSMVTANGHFKDEFTVSPSGVVHHLVISGLQAPGFLGFFYRNFGSSNIGKAFLKSYRDYLEAAPPPESK